jgi:hypothetical protein
MTRSLRSLLAAVLVLAATACGVTEPRPVPDVTGKRLDVAEDTLDTVGLGYRTDGGGAFGVVIRSRWVVCEQAPLPPVRATTVLLVVARACSIPRVVGETLSDARDELEEAGAEIRVHSLDGDGVIVDAFWTVCRQSPTHPAPEQTVDLYVSHNCWWVDP